MHPAIPPPAEITGHIIAKSIKPIVKEMVSACFFCAGYCGVVISLDEDDRVVKVVGDKANPNSQGFICNKGVNLFTSLDNPQRLTQPLKRIDGELVPISWDEALTEIAEKLRNIRAKKGARSLAFAFGGSEATSPPMILGTMMMNMLGSHSVYSPTGLEFLARFLVAEKMYGAAFMDGHADFANANYAVIIGSNPLVSCPPEGIALRELAQSPERTLVVIDPRRTETAKIADHYLGINISTDVYFLLAMLQVIVTESLYDKTHVDAHSSGLATLFKVITPFIPEVAAQHTGIAAEKIVAVARGYASAPRAVLHYHMGVVANQHATLVAWLVQVIKFITNNKGRKGGSLINPILIDMNRLAKMNKHVPVYSSRTLHGLGHIAGCLPSVMLPEEILTPGDGQIRALIVSSCNPLKGYGDAHKMARAFDDLELLVSIDPFLTEVGRKADYVLPNCAHHEQENLFFAHPWMFKNEFVHLVEKVRDPRGDSWPEWKIFREIIKRTKPEGFSNHVMHKVICFFELLHRVKGTPGGFNQQRGLIKMIARFGGVSWSDLLKKPSGFVINSDKPYDYLKHIDTEDGLVHLAIAEFMEAVSTLPVSVPAEDAQFPFKLSTICRSKANTNTMFHNVLWMQKHRREHDLRVNTQDAEALGIFDGDAVQLISATASQRVTVMVTDDVVAGTMHLSHGWGLQARSFAVTSEHEKPLGVAAGLFSSHDSYDTFTGMPLLSGVPCRVERCH